MRRFKNVQLLENLAPFALPPLKRIKISYLSKAERDVKHFLVHSLGQLKDLSLNQGGDSLDGSEWVEAIAKALPRVKKYVYLWRFNFSKEQMEAIVDNSFHLESLDINECKLRKWCDLRCNTLILKIYWMDIPNLDFVSLGEIVEYSIVGFKSCILLKGYGYSLFIYLNLS
jgi:hypothetical protein